MEFVLVVCRFRLSFTLHFFISPFSISAFFVVFPAPGRLASFSSFSPFLVRFMTYPFFDDFSAGVFAVRLDFERVKS